ncbi:MAG: acyl-CoA thioesterase, partial [Chroococcales cyanobacterium]
DTDAAGVVYFANVLIMCHEAYEEAIASVGINLKTLVNNPSIAIPLVHSSVDFFRPIYCGDKILISLTPQVLSENEFEVSYKIVSEEFPEKVVAQAKTRHVCIDPQERKRVNFPETINKWLSEK